MEYLLDIYQNKRIFVFNDTEVRSALRDALNFRTRSRLPCHEKTSVQIPSLKIGFLLK